MKKLLLVASLLLSLTGAASAQNVICATRPVTDNSNACASTAFVNNYVSSPSSPIFSTPHTWTATQTFASVSGASALFKTPTGAPTTLAATATLAQMYMGSSGTPSASGVPAVSISKYSNSVLAAGVYDTPLFIETIGTNTSAPGVSPLGGTFIRATQNGIGDVLGLGVEVIGNGGGGRYTYGYFYNVWAKKAPDTAAFGIEGYIQNDAAAVPYVKGATGIYFTHLNFSSGGLYDTTVGTYYWQGAYGKKMDTGTVCGVGAITSACFWDDSSGTYSYRDTGTHTTGIDLTQATYSGNAMQSTGFIVNNTGNLAALSLTATQNAGVLFLTGLNATIEIGRSGTSNTPNVNFHSGTIATTYDSRIIASGGSGSDGGGTLTVMSATLALPAITTINGIQAVSTSATQTLTNKTISGSANTFTNIPNSALVNASTTVNGQNCTLGATCTVSAAATSITVGTTTIASGTSGYVLYNNGGTLGNLANTGTGNNVLATSPTLVTPILGTPTSVTLTNATGLPVGTGISGLGSGVATFLATPTSANLAAALTDETGTGAAVFAQNPNLNAPGIDTGIIYNTMNPSADGTVTLGTSALRYATTYTNNITASGQSARTWSMARQTTAATGGQNLTIAASGAVSGGSNLVGGNLILSGGTSTGNGGAAGTGSAVVFYAAPSSGSSGSADVPAVETMRIMNVGGYGFLTYRNTNTAAYAITGSSTDDVTYFNGLTGLNMRISNIDRVRLTTSLLQIGTPYVSAPDPGVTVHLGTASAAAPAVTSCGTSPSIAGTDTAGEITMGTGSPTACTITFNVAYVSSPFCTVTWQANPLLAQSYAVTTTAITLTQTATSSNKVNYHCTARAGG